MKNRKMSKVFVLVVLTFSLLAGCGNNVVNNGSASSEPVQNSALDKVTVVGYLLGEAPPNARAVMDEINKKLEAEINANLKINYIPFGDIGTKYPLLLSAGEEFDFIYGSIDYANNALKGGYREINMKDVEEYMPLTFKATSKQAWQDTLVNGKSYMIPQSFKELAAGAFFYREDLRKKYNVPEIKIPADLEAYFAAIKNNESEFPPFDGNADDIASLFKLFMGGWANGDNLYNLNFDDPTYTVKGLLDDDFVADYKKAAEIIKAYHDKGYLPKNPFAQKTSARELIKSGKTGLFGDSFEVYPQRATDFAAQGWEIGALPVTTSKGTTLMRPATGNGISFSRNSKNYERAMMVIDRIMQDPTYNMLVSFGIEGTDYVMKDGKLAAVPENKTPFPMYGLGFWMSNRDQHPSLESYTQDYIDKKNTLKENAVPYLLNGFNPNLETLKTEVANIKNVMQQYEMPIRVGLAKDIDASIETLREKLRAAGAQKVIDEYKKQVAEYVSAHKAK